MAMTEERALEILQELIKKPDSKAEDVPRVWSEILAVYRQAFATSDAPAKKKRRRRSGGNPNLVGWPQGVKRAEYQAWKEQQLAAGLRTDLNPQAYKRQRDGGLNEAPKATKTGESKANNAAASKKATVSKGKK